MCFVTFAKFRIFFTTLITKPFSLFKLLIQDIYIYILKKGYNRLESGNINAYVGSGNKVFGNGKTLTVVNLVRNKYKRYNDKLAWCFNRKKIVLQKVLILSNVHLTDVPYVQFISLDQIVKISKDLKKLDEVNNTRTCLIVLGDEFSTQLNSRNFKSNIDGLFLNTLLTSRHYNIDIYYTSQRFKHTDALIRQVTNNVIECDKTWRLQGLKYFDAWEVENATTTSILKPYRRTGFFVTNEDYNAYNTLAVVDNLIKSMEEGDMLTNEEILNLLNHGNENLENVTTLKRSVKRKRKR